MPELGENFDEEIQMISKSTQKSIIKKQNLSTLHLHL